MNAKTGTEDGAAESAAPSADVEETERETAPGPTDRSATEAARREAAALRRVRRVSRLLDEAVRVPGTSYRVGLDPILGVLPVGGDAVAAALSLYPVAEAYRFGARKRTLAKMLSLVAVDAVVGSVPVLGTVFDAVWKANEWNRRTFERVVERE